MPDAAPNAAITYNGYEFPDRSKFRIDESYVYDDAQVTVVETKFKLRVETIICSLESGSNDDHLASGNYAGREMHRVRQLLSKAGGQLQVKHDGWGPNAPYLTLGGSVGNQVRDVSMGPRPRVLTWNPIGNTAAVEVVWECEFSLPICDGQSPPNFTGLSAFNYSITFDINEGGFTTRRINGYIEIAMMRNGRTIVDSADRYRHKVMFEKPPNFERVATFDISLDKRRGTFSITDTEIESPNPYPVGARKIDAKHRVGWRRGNSSQLMNSITASIQTYPGIPKMRAWLIFNEIVTRRMAYAHQSAAEQARVFIDNIEVEEDIYSYRTQFAMTYRILDTPGMLAMINSTGLLLPLAVDNTNWQDWAIASNQLQPFQGIQDGDRGVAKLYHDFAYDRVVDLCDSQSGFQPSYSDWGSVPSSGRPSALCNRKPPPAKSWIRFEGEWIIEEDQDTHVAVTLGPSDMQFTEFNPAKLDDTLPPDDSDSIRRFVETYAGEHTLIWQGAAERAGYPIPRPGKMRIGNLVLKPVGKGTFKPKFEGNFYCVPKYSAMWSIKYKLIKRLADGDPAKANPVEEPEEAEEDDDEPAPPAPGDGGG